METKCLFSYYSFHHSKSELEIIINWNDNNHKKTVDLCVENNWNCGGGLWSDLVLCNWLLHNRGKNVYCNMCVVVNWVLNKCSRRSVCDPFFMFFTFSLWWILNIFFFICNKNRLFYFYRLDWNFTSSTKKNGFCCVVIMFVCVIFFLPFSFVFGKLKNQFNRKINRSLILSVCLWPIRLKLQTELKFCNVGRKTQKKNIIIYPIKMEIWPVYTNRKKTSTNSNSFLIFA